MLASVELCGWFCTRIRTEHERKCPKVLGELQLSLLWLWICFPCHSRCTGGNGSCPESHPTTATATATGAGGDIDDERCDLLQRFSLALASPKEQHEMKTKASSLLTTISMMCHCEDVSIYNNNKADEEGSPALEMTTRMRQQMRRCSLLNCIKVITLLESEIWDANDMSLGTGKIPPWQKPKLDCTAAASSVDKSHKRLSLSVASCETFIDWTNWCWCFCGAIRKRTTSSTAVTRATVMTTSVPVPTPIKCCWVRKIRPMMILRALPIRAICPSPAVPDEDFRGRMWLRPVILSRANKSAPPWVEKVMPVCRSLKTAKTKTIIIIIISGGHQSDSNIGYCHHPCNTTTTTTMPSCPTPQPAFSQQQQPMVGGSGGVLYQPELPPPVQFFLPPGGAPELHPQQITRMHSVSSLVSESSHGNTTTTSASDRSVRDELQNVAIERTKGRRSTSAGGCAQWTNISHSQRTCPQSNRERQQQHSSHFYQSLNGAAGKALWMLQQQSTEWWHLVACWSHCMLSRLMRYFSRMQICE